MQQQLKVRYFFKPKTKYPERIYVLYGDWRPRNMRQMGISKVNPFFDRLATPAEQKADAGSMRMVYFQYENLDTLFKDEEKLGTCLEDFKNELCLELWRKHSKELKKQIQAAEFEERVEKGLNILRAEVAQIILEK